LYATRAFGPAAEATPAVITTSVAIIVTVNTMRRLRLIDPMGE
jgi:hypothetical protein